MVAINGNNNISSYSSKGFSGLASGVDTESLVKQLLANTQSKIDKQTALKQQTIWKQDIYRDLITSFQGFQNKYFNYLSPKTNLLSSSFYQSKSVKSNSSAVKVSSVGDILNNKLTINRIESLASAAKHTSAVTASGQIQLNFDVSQLASMDGDATLTMKLDGITKTIKLDNTSGSNEDMVAKLNASVKQAFGAGISFHTDGTVSLSADRQLVITGNAKAQAAMGFKDGVSNKLNGNTSLKSLNLKEPLSGNSFEFKINDVAFKFDGNATINDVISKVNSSSAGVKMTYSSLTDKFALESTTLGAGVDIELEQTKGNLLTSLFGVSSGSEVSSFSLNAQSIAAVDAYDLTDVKEGVFKLEVNGVEHSISIPQNDAYTQEDIIQILNVELGKKFGAENIKLEVAGSNLTLQTKHGYAVTVLNDGDGNIGSKLGFADNANNIVTAGSTLKELGFTNPFTVNGHTFDGDSTIGALAGAGLQFDNGVLSLTNAASGFIFKGDDAAGTAFVKTLFGSAVVELNGAEIARDEIAGNNAKLTVNGNEIERNTNEFNIDGYQITLQETSETAIELSSESNTDQILDGIVQFVNDYNNLIEKISKLVTQKQTYKQYAPLTSDQKKEMSEKEVELWEEKAKEGLISNDSLLNNILGQMRSSLYKRPDGSAIALYEIGITTSANYKDGGKLIIDEEKLRAAINQDPAEIAKLFSNPTDGLAVTMNKIMDGAAKSSVASPGSLVRLAGMKNTSSETQNTLNQQMKSIEENITRLNRRYELEKTRYWRQFSAMETVINKSNSQSAWLSNMYQ